MKSTLVALSVLLSAANADAATVDPFAGAPTGRTAVPAGAARDVPANAPQLSLARPYAIFTGASAPLALPAEGTPAPTNAGDWYQFWRVDAALSNAASILARRSKWGIRGPIVADGDMDAVIAVAGAANHPGILIKPGVTGDAALDRYGVGFMVRMVADRCGRIPLPTLDLSSADAAAAPWIGVWVGECVRNGVVGIRVIRPKNALAAKALDDALTPLTGPNVYLPPLSEVAILIPAGAAGAPETFRAYAGLRASGVWPEFVTDAQLGARTVSLARFQVIVLPDRTDAESRRLVDDAARRGATVMIVGAAPTPGERILATTYDGKPTITERRVGDGRVLTAAVAPWSADGTWAGFWEGILGDAGVPKRPWLEAVTAANVARVTGRYTRPTPAK